MVAEFHDRPFGSHGEMLVPPVEPAPPAPQPFVIPEWPEEERRRAAQGAVEPQTTETAIERMMREALERGEIDEPAPLGPPLEQHQALQRFVPPEADWEQVERDAIRENQRVERERARHLLNEEETPARFPPARRGAA
jgi:hypothetical protein